MHKASVVLDMPCIPHHQSAEITQPRKQPLDLPAPLVAPQHPAVLRLRLRPIPAMRRNHRDPLCRQSLVQRVGVVRLVPDQSFGHRFHPAGIEDRIDKGDFMRRSARCANGDWKTSTVCHCHEFRTFAPLGLSHPCAPFLAPTKVPSTKHSLPSISPRSCKSVARAASTRSSVPSRTHAWKRRCTVVCGGYRSGRSCHCAPVLSIHSTPSRTGRRGVHGLPRPSARRGGAGISGSSRAHCSSVKSLLRAPPRTQPTIYEMASSRTPTTTSNQGTLLSSRSLRLCRTARAHFASLRR